MKVHVHAYRLKHKNTDSRSKKPEKVVRHGVTSVHLFYDFHKNYKNLNNVEQKSKEKYQQNF